MRNEDVLFTFHLYLCHFTLSHVAVGEAAAPELEEDEVDLRCYRPAGGVMDIGLFTLPPQPKAVQQWTLKQGKLPNAYLFAC